MATNVLVQKLSFYWSTELAEEKAGSDGTLSISSVLFPDTHNIHA